MREIKFRVWTGIDYEYNIMAGFLGAFYVQGIDENDTASMSPFNTRYENCPIEQYTGLKDKNGKEIYEGDILKIRRCSRYETHKVELKGGMFFAGYNHGSSTTKRQKKIRSSDVEIIGNIHENKELA